MGLAVYTTIYPGVEAYLPAWYRSLSEQTDQEFELWIGLDMLEKESVQNLLGAEVNARWVQAPAGSTPAAIRQQALARVVETCTEVVLVDSDDVLSSSRVAAARHALQSSELAGCALRLVDQQGNDLNQIFDLHEHVEPRDVLARNNVFGFSNSAYRADLLSRCLPIPAEAVLADWYLATRAWLKNATLAFDRVPRMAYRQHPENTARVLSPFSREQVISDTALVRRHYQLVFARADGEFVESRYAELKRAARAVEEFFRHVVQEPTQLDAYVEALNALAPPPLWWSTVAYPALEPMWKS